ncbi:hypothetical protein DYB32_008105 [Aphanomyces invadans]|uniref:SPX domain-containing protein n=1 Tax=Aphanomyces invadans TaxID=157072 RepID=A0A3R6YZM9_9STRA|nr:hypothetical protein DYB32_008105 [Aphanomyces invadans]
MKDRLNRCMFIIGTYWLYPSLRSKRLLSLLFWLSWCNLIYNSLVWLGSVWQYSDVSLGCSVQLVVQQFAGVGILLLSAVISIELLRAVSGWQAQTPDHSGWYHAVVWTMCTICACVTIWTGVLGYVPDTNYGPAMACWTNHTPLWGRIAFFYLPVLVILVLSLHALQVAIHRLHSTNLIQTESGRRSSQLLVSYVIVFGITSVAPALVGLAGLYVNLPELVVYTSEVCFYAQGFLHCFVWACSPSFQQAYTQRYYALGEHEVEGLKLAHNLVPEWEEHYVNYADLKYHVKQIQRRKSFLDISSGDYTETCDTEKTRLIKTSKPTHFEEEFLNECEKVESWYCAQLEEFQKQYALLKAQYADACATQAPLLVSQEDFDESPESEAFALERHSIKQSFVELYKVLRMLQNFALLNYTALRKVLKKHKKKCGDRYQKAHRSLNDSLHDYAFSHALPVKEAIFNLEHYFTTTFHENDRVLALAELDDWKDSTLNWQNVYTGLKMGICIVLALWLLWDDVVVVGLQGQTNPTVIRLMQTSAYPFYRGIALFLFFLWLWGGTLYTWQAARINYRCGQCVPAIGVDFVLCFSWTLALIPPTKEYSIMGFLLYLQPITMFMEPIRRSMWSCFAMENEHLRNTLGFRKERFIPLHFERKKPVRKTDKQDDKQYAYKVVALAIVVAALSASAIFLGN